MTVKKISPSELVALISDKTGVEKSNVTAVINGLKEVVDTALHNDEAVDLGRDFGKFSVKRMAKRVTTLPNGEKITSPERFSFSFLFNKKYRSLPMSELKK